MGKCPISPVALTGVVSGHCSGVGPASIERMPKLDFDIWIDAVVYIISFGTCTIGVGVASRGPISGDMDCCNWAAVPVRITSSRESITTIEINPPRRRLREGRHMGVALVALGTGYS